MTTGILERIQAQLDRIESRHLAICERLNALATQAVPLTADEEAWADGPVSVEEACAFLRVEKSKLFDLIRRGEIVSAKDGRRLIAKRGLIRYLAAHQEYRSAE